MALIKYNPVLAPSTFSNLVDRLFTDVYSDNASLRFIPDVDLTETEQAYEVHVSLPGFKKEDIHVEVKDGALTISGERKFVKESKKYHSLESNYGAFSRSFTLPDNVDSQQVAAQFNNGILEVTIAKDAKKAVAQRVEIK